MPNLKEIVFAAEDEFGKVIVIEDQSCRKLIFDSEVEQGCLFLNAPMQIAFEYQTVILQQVEQWHHQNNRNRPFKVLMLGLGSGSLTQHLLNCFDINLTVIELRQKVIDCAYEFFALPDTPDIDVLQADAIDFCEQQLYPYDVIIVDIFDANGEASQLNEAAFLNNLWRLTQQNGLLIFNLWHEWQGHPSDHPAQASRASQKVVDFWQNFSKQLAANENQQCQLNRYNIVSSQNLVLTLRKSV